MPEIPLTARGPIATVDVGRAPEPASAMPRNTNPSRCSSISSILMWTILPSIWSWPLRKSRTIWPGSGLKPEIYLQTGANLRLLPNSLGWVMNSYNAERIVCYWYHQFSRQTRITG